MEGESSPERSRAESLAQSSNTTVSQPKPDSAATESTSFTSAEKKKLVLLIAFIMAAKFGFENLKGSWKTNIINKEILDNGKHPLQTVAYFDSAFYVLQMVGSMLPAGLMKRHKLQHLLFVAGLATAICSSIPLIVEACTGGTIKPGDVASGDEGLSGYFGRYKVTNMLPVWSMVGLCWGMIDTMRRIAPSYIVGSNEAKLKRVGSIVHICYEIAGTTGNILNGMVLVNKLGSNFAFISAPIALFFAGCIALRIDFQMEESRSLENGTAAPAPQRHITIRPFCALGNFVVNWFRGLWFGARTICTSRDLIWLIPAFSFALYNHRYMEDQLMKKVAAKYFGRNEWSEITIAGLNLGEMIGAGLLCLFNGLIHTPIPWIRFDALTLFVMWYLGFWYPPRDDVKQPFYLAAGMSCATVGFAAGDVAVSAYMQSQLKQRETDGGNFNVAASAMGFLNVVWIGTYAALGGVLGKYMDSAWLKDNPAGTPKVELTAGQNTHHAMTMLAGVQFTIIAVMIFAATFIPKGAVAWNPKSLGYQAPVDEEYELESNKNAAPSVRCG